MKRVSVGAAVAVGLSLASNFASAATETVLYSFKGGTDGANPLAGSIMDSTGALYGTTLSGGSAGVGTVLKLTPPAKGATSWTEKVLYSFKGGTDGSYPSGSLIFDKAGVLYGTTAGGSGGKGTVFKLTPPAPGKTTWTKKVLYAFRGGANGASPMAGLINDASGALYGATENGGSTTLNGGDGYGTVFKLTPPAPGMTSWTEKVLYSFRGGNDGALPGAGLVAGASGVFYGTTLAGGTGSGQCFFTGLNCGTVFELVPSAKSKTGWSESVIYNFAGGSDGFGPGQLVVNSTGSLYGTTPAGGSGFGNCGSGCGTVFALTPMASAGWTKQTLYKFTDQGDGANPTSGLVLNAAGALYGTSGGGVGNVNGGVFKLTPPASGASAWTEAIIYGFASAGSSGADPNGGLISDSSGSLYGTTQYGGSGNCPGGGGYSAGCGTIFKLTP